jgi:hypothetical protein
MVIGPCCNKSHNPLIVSGAKDPMHVCTGSGSVRNFYNCAEFPATY